MRTIEERITEIRESQTYDKDRDYRLSLIDQLLADFKAEGIAHRTIREGADGHPDVPSASRAKLSKGACEVCGKPMEEFGRRTRIYRGGHILMVCHDCFRDAPEEERGGSGHAGPRERAEVGADHGKGD